MSTESFPVCYSFDNVEVRSSERLLLVDGRRVAIGARAFDVLVTLIEHRDRVVTKGELFDSVWAGLVVEDNNLATQVSALRRLLGPHVIATVPNHGYRFVAVAGDAARESVAQTAAVGSAPSGIARSVTNLPASLAPLYGREDDLHALSGCIEAHHLVTVVGTSGMGKTRLAQAAAHAMTQRFPGGVWFVELASLLNASMVPSAVAHTLGIALHGQGAPSSELAAAIEAKRMLVVLDNGERLLPDVAALAQAILSRAHEVRLLLTSQVPLGLSDEQVFRLQPLAVPIDSDPSCALDYGAVRLFCARAAALDRHFAFGVENSAAVVEICRHLDGLPLALELAAARIPLLGVDGVHERLGARLRLLVSGSRGHPSRHQTLRAALDWSHELLDTAERIALRRLAVLAGGCSIEAALFVVSDEHDEESLVMDTLRRLVDRSVVVSEGAGRRRVRLLESIRAYSMERLIDSGELAQVQRRRAKYFATYFEGVANALYRGTLTEHEFIRVRAAEIDNIRESIDESLDAQPDPHVALGLLTAVAPMCHLMSLRTQAPRWWRTFLQRFGAQLSGHHAASCRFAWIHWGQSVWWSRGEWPDWPSSVTWSLADLGDVRRQAHALCVQALMLSMTGDFDAARSALQAAGELESPDWPAWLRTRRALFRARFDRESGHATDGHQKLTEALMALEATGEGSGRWAYLIRTELALEALSRGHAGEAAHALYALLELGRVQHQDNIGMGPVLAALTWALTELGRLDEAAALAADAAQQLNRAALWVRFGTRLAFLAARLGNLHQAAAMIGAIDAQASRTGTRLSPEKSHARARVLAEIAITHTPQQIESWRVGGSSLDSDALTHLAQESCRMATRATTGQARSA